MVSIIVSSYHEAFFERFSKSVDDTIGSIDYEIIQIWNPGTKGICEAYNEGAALAKGDYYCFVHEDVLFETKGWGQILIDKALEPEVGVLGFAGAMHVSGLPYWYNPNGARYFFKQMTKDGDLHHDFTHSRLGEDFTEVMVLDGMLLFCRKGIWEEVKFDALNFKGFHIYDIDFSYDVSQKYKNYVCQTVTIGHYSLGNLNKEYYEGLLDFYNKWNGRSNFVDTIPFSKILVYQIVIELMVKAKVDLKFVFHYLKSVGLIKHFSDVLFVYYCTLKINLKSFLK